MRSPPFEGTSLVKQWRGETLGDLEPVYHLFTIMSEITLPLAAISAEHAPKNNQQNMPQKAVEEKTRDLQNAKKNNKTTKSKKKSSW